MESLVDLVSSSTDPRARARFQNLQLKKKVKEFRVAMRGYKRPDFNRMILDLCRLGWTHEKIAFVLPVANASTVSEWARGGKPNYENGVAVCLSCVFRWMSGEISVTGSAWKTCLLI